MIAEKCIDRSYVFSVGGYQIPACPPWHDLQKSSKTLLKKVNKVFLQKALKENFLMKISRKKSLKEILSKKSFRRKYPVKKSVK